MAVSLATSAPASQQRSTTFGEPHQPAAVAPYAHAAWVKLGALVPTDAETADVYVRRIAIEGKVLLPRDE